MSETLVTLWGGVRRRLEAAGVDTPALDARLLLEAGAGVTRLDILTDPRRTLTESQVAAVDALALRREEREPVAQILGRKHFWTLDLHINADVLIPRPETELLVETALEVIAPKQAARVLDLGVGSGAVLLAVLSERPKATGVGVDISPNALDVARVNARALRLSDRADFRLGDWEPGAESFDLVLSNPPYVASGALADLAPEVARFEPRLALDGGQDGLDAHRAIIGKLGRLLRPRAHFALEVGAGQAEAVRDLVREAGLATGPPRRDLGGVARVVSGRRAA